MNACFCVGSRSSQPAARHCFSHTKRPRQQLEPRAPLPNPPRATDGDPMKGRRCPADWGVSCLPFQRGKADAKSGLPRGKKSAGTV